MLNLLVSLYTIRQMLLQIVRQDLTFAIFLSLIRKILFASEFVKKGNGKHGTRNCFLEELNGKVFGILGFGKIGQAVAQRAVGFGLKIIYYNRYKKDVDCFFSSNVRSVDLNELLETSDYLSIHLPLTDETEGFINMHTINKMKKNPIVLNIARGGIIDTDDLVEGLKSGKIRGAGLDVTAPEPLSSDHLLPHLDNCILVPHT